MERIDTLNGQAFVELVDSIGDDHSIVNAARVSYAGDHQDRPAERDRKLIRYLLKNHHTSPFEHVTFTFHVKAPIFVARQWHRHRTWSYNEVSARYTEVKDDYYFPSEWRGQSKDNKQMSDGLIDSELQPHANHQYLEACGKAFSAYEALLDMGVSREMARMVLPQSAFTRFYATVDLHNLLGFIRLRGHEHAQEEIREYAIAMRELITPYVPWTMEAWEGLQ